MAEVVGSTRSSEGNLVTNTAEDRLSKALAERGAAVAALALQSEARDALYVPAVWRGLPARARRWWALQALGTLSYTRARLLARVSKRQARRWRVVIVARIESRRRDEPEDD